jgi:hypothetical protein
MISVIVYGRNDSYGYNLPKRAAISLNCIAEVLTDPQDEILFVDCNTPNGMPTFPEAIADTLTAKARRLLRILRLRPDLYDKHKKGSRLKALEPLSRNIAVRRSNPANRWILSTNTDMVFVVRDSAKSLSDVAAGLPDGLYELPRFEVPGALWESVDRHDPRRTISKFAHWGQKLHLNVAILSRPEIRFDGPGDFQLMPRGQIFAIHGFNEDMVLGWHVDSNLCRRLNLLNGKTDSLLDEVFAYHCDHTRQVTAMHDSAHRSENDQNRFIYDVHSPFLPNQEASWGLPDVDIEELRLNDDGRGNYDRAMEKLLPGMVEPVASDSYWEESFDQSQIYDNLHVFPYLADYLNDIRRSDTIGYFGANVELLDLLCKFLVEFDYRGTIVLDHDLLAISYPSNPAKLSGNYRIVDRESLLSQSDIFVFDIALMPLWSPDDAKDSASLIACQKADDFRERLANSFYQTIVYERKRLSSDVNQERQFLLIGAHHTWFEGVVLKAIGTTVTPYSTHVRQGFASAIPHSSGSNRRFGRLVQIGRSIQWISSVDKTGMARHYSLQGKLSLRGRDYRKARLYFYKAFLMQPFYGKNLRRFVLACLWGLREIYIQYKTFRHAPGTKFGL